MARTMMPLLMILSAGIAVHAAEEPAKRLPSVKEMADSRQDVWGEASLAAYAAPGRWLKDGAVVNVQRAPTMFGEVSFRIESRLSRGEVVAHITAPSRRPDHWSLRLPLRSGWKVMSAKVGESAVTLEKDGSADLTPRSGRFTLRFQVERVQP